MDNLKIQTVQICTIMNGLRSMEYSRKIRYAVPGKRLLYPFTYL